MKCNLCQTCGLAVSHGMVPDPHDCAIVARHEAVIRTLADMLRLAVEAICGLEGGDCDGCPLNTDTVGTDCIDWTTDDYIAEARRRANGG